MQTLWTGLCFSVGKLSQKMIYYDYTQTNYLTYTNTFKIHYSDLVYLLYGKVRESGSTF